MAVAEMIADLVSHGYGIYIDSGDDGTDEQDKPWTYSIIITTLPKNTGEGWHCGAEYLCGIFGHDVEQALQEIYEEVPK